MFGQKYSAAGATAEEAYSQTEASCHCHNGETVDSRLKIQYCIKADCVGSGVSMPVTKVDLCSDSINLDDQEFIARIDD